MTDTKTRDGRHARSERTRNAVAEAMLDCLEEGIGRPTAKEVAERAGVSSRAVFRHFDNLEALREAVAEVQIERVLLELPPVLLEGALPDRIDSLVRHTARRNERIAPVRRVARAAEADSVVIRDRLAWMRQGIRQQIRRVFEPELARLPEPERRQRVAALRALLSFSYWDELRQHEKLSVPATSRILGDALRASLQEETSK